MCDAPQSWRPEAVAEREVPAASTLAVSEPVPLPRVQRSAGPRVRPHTAAPTRAAVSFEELFVIRQ